MSAYEHVGGALKIKGIEKKSKKKKDQAKQQESLEKGVEKAVEAAEKPAATSDGPVDEFKGKTPAEIKFILAQRERELDRIKAKTALSHKEKVQKLNQYLDGLSEYYDIPKVSWTK
eukprot:m.232669 g.232669  ORF g.232669 m.232669 type:complete len:116 (+) comp12391_c0_seq1:41-388(+)